MMPLRINRQQVPVTSPCDRIRAQPANDTATIVRTNNAMCKGFMTCFLPNARGETRILILANCLEITATSETAARNSLNGLRHYSPEASVQGRHDAKLLNGLAALLRARECP